MRGNTRPVVEMYNFTEECPAPSPMRSGAAVTALVLAALLVLALGLVPSQYLAWATQSVLVVGP